MDRREHAGGRPNTDRVEDQWVPMCEFPYEILPEFSHENPKEYPLEKFTEALRQISEWILNDGKFQERGVTDRAMVFAWMISPAMTGCNTQAELAAKMNLSQSQICEYVKQFTERFDFVCGATYTKRQTKNRRRKGKDQKF